MLQQPVFIVVLANAFTRTLVLRIAHINHQQIAVKFGLQNLQGLAHGARKLGVGDQHRSFAMVYLPCQQTGIQTRVEGVENRIQSGYRVMCFNHFRRVGQHHTDSAAAFDASGL